MGEYYLEQMVKQKATMSTKIKRAAVGAMVALVLLLCVISLAAIPLFLATVAFAWYLMKRLDYEYEYLYYNGDLDIDKIMGKQKRKRVFEASVKTIDVLAPTGSIELQQFQNLKAYDCSSNSGNKTYEMVLVNKKGQKVRVIFEPSEKILENMRMLEPRKVFI